jgi:nifR3 family TIM-barrel protein
VLTGVRPELVDLCPEPVEGPLTGAQRIAAASVVLAPMAGITNAAYRQLCREQAELGGATGSLFVCEMITSRGIVEGDPKTLAMLQFDPGERTRSVQLYGVDPTIMAQATTILINDYGVAHVDLNFGCPVPKVTRKGGGAALPYKRERLRMILTATVRAAAAYDVPVTIKTRIGIDGDHQTFLDAGRIAEESGCAAIALHGRTAQQAYSGAADWTAIAALKSHVAIPVFGNGDIWEAGDALRMLAETGADGVVVGRGCLGRPWLFRDLADACAGRETRALPTLGEVMIMMRRHARLLAGLSDERHGCAEFRKHVSWYLKGFPVGGELRRALAMVSTLSELDDLLDRLDPATPYPASELGVPRGRQGGPRSRVALPEGWLDETSGRDLDLVGAELGISGG